MSRLDSAIRRLKAQRACLNLAAQLIERVPGAIFELGLGNGRTYDHLRSLLPHREIFVFDRQVAAHPDCVPDSEHLFLGEFADTLPKVRTRFTNRVSLIHADFGTGRAEASSETARAIAAHVPGLVCAAGVIVTDEPLSLLGFVPLPLPSAIETGRYFLYSATIPGKIR